MTFTKALAISASIHLALFSCFFYSSQAATTVHFDVRSGVSGILLELSGNRGNRIAQEREEQLLHDVQVIFSDEGSYSIKTGPDRKNNKSENKTRSGGNRSYAIGALSEMARNNSLNNPPEYPYVARRMKYEGMVTLSIEVKTDGTAGKVDILNSSGNSLLDQSALKAARRWVFFQKDEMQLAEPVYITQDIIFSLKK